MEKILERSKISNILKISKIKKIKISICIIFITLIIAFIATLIIPIVIKYYKEWNFNNSIIKSTDQNIKFENITELNLFDNTVENIKSNKKSIEILYKDYNIILNTEQLNSANKFNTNIGIKKSKYKEFIDLNTLEIDTTSFNPQNIVDQIEINTQTFLNGYKRIDIYGENINNNNIEFIETKEIEDENMTITLIKEYKKYILVYIPIEEIETEKQDIQLFKNEEYKMKISILPNNATTKMIHINELNNENVIKITDDGTIQAVGAGMQEFDLEAEDGKVKKKITVTVKQPAEGIEVISKNLQLTEGKSKNLQAKILPEDVADKRLNYESSNEKIAKVNAEGNITAVKAGQALITVSTYAEPIQKVEVNVTVQKEVKINNPSVQIENNNNNSNTNSAILNNYINGVLVVNKKYTLPSNYNPGTNPTALQAFNKMKNFASQQEINLKIVSGYRSYQTQVSLYQRNVQLYGEEVANVFSAKPGQSEHQTGLAFDVNSTKWDFKDTKEGKWLADNCYRYGFIIRYPENKQDKTGYVYEPWHIRYVGTNISEKIYSSGKCLEEYLGI